MFFYILNENCIFIGRICYLCLVDYKVGDATIAAFIKSRNTKEEVIMPKRGTRYDVNGNIKLKTPDLALYNEILESDILPESVENL